MEYKSIHKLNSEDKVLHLKKKLFLKILFWQISVILFLGFYGYLTYNKRSYQTVLNFTLNMGYVSYSLPCGGGL